MNDVPVRSAVESLEYAADVGADRIVLASDARYAMSLAVTLWSLSRSMVRPTEIPVIVLSDGKPNDIDLYEGPYGVEDSRQAVAEARRQGIHVRCLTIDREAPRYAHRIFGALGFARLPRADRLPMALVEMLRGHLHA